MKFSLPVRFSFVIFLMTQISFEANAQTTYTDQMVQDNINLRRKEEIYKSRRAGSSSATRTAASSKPAIRPSKVYFAPDMYNALPASSLTVTFSFSPIDQPGKAYQFTQTMSGNENAIINGVPAGTYTVTAKSGSRRILLGSEIGGPSDPNGGNFAISQRIQIRPGKDGYGNAIMQSNPETIWMRVK